MFLLIVREAALKPFFKFRKGDLTVGAFGTLCNCLILPLFEIGFFNLPYTDTGDITLIILLIQRNGGIVRHFLFVVFLCGKVLAVTGFALVNAVALISLVVALHNEILSAAFALLNWTLCSSILVNSISRISATEPIIYLRLIK